MKIIHLKSLSILSTIIARTMQNHLKKSKLCFNAKVSDRLYFFVLHWLLKEAHPSQPWMHLRSCNLPFKTLCTRYAVNHFKDNQFPLSRTS